MLDSLVPLLAVYVLATLPVDTHPAAGKRVPESPVEADGRELAQLIDECDEIVLARIERITQVAGPLPGAQSRRVELAVERVLWGEAGVRSRIVDVRPPDAAVDAHGALAIGERAVWFVERALFPSSTEPPASEPFVVARTGQGHFVVEHAEKGDTVCVAPAAFRLPAGVAARSEHRAAQADASWSRLDLGGFVEWLTRAISARVPSVRAEVHGSGPAGPGGGPWVEIGPEGTASIRDPYGPKRDARVDVGAAGMKAIIALADEQEFFRLPARLGASTGPDSASTTLRIRTEHGARRVHVLGPPRASERVEFARLKTVWNAIPVARDWKIDGH